MKTIKQLSLLLCTSALLSSCGFQLREKDLLTDRDAKEKISEAYLLSTMTRDIAIATSSSGFMNLDLPAAIQLQQHVTYGQGNTFEGWQEAKPLLNDNLDKGIYVYESSLVAKANNNYSYAGIFLIFRSLLFMQSVDMYGDVYYTQAFKGREGNFFPKYDTQKDIYYGLCNDLDSANTLIAKGIEGIDPIQDIMYKGDKLKWRKFCNSLRLRIAMRLAEKDPEKVKAELHKVLSDPTTYPLMTTNSDNAMITTVGTNKNNSWWLGSNTNDASSYGRKKPCKTLVDIMRSANDPRLPILFTPLRRPWTDKPELNGKAVLDQNGNPLKDPTTGYAYGSTWEYLDPNNPEIAKVMDKVYPGTINQLYEGARAMLPMSSVNENGCHDGSPENDNPKLSGFSNLFSQNSNALLQFTLMNADEVQFILAEAALRGMISGDAETYYKKGIELAMGRWKLSVPADFYTRPSISFTGTVTQKRELIADQKFCALCLDANEAYADSRRTRLPAKIFDNIAATQYEFPARFRYPTTEPGTNNEAYEIGLKSLKPQVDDQFSKIWLLQ